MARRKERQLLNGQWHTKPKRGAPRPLPRNDGWMTESEYLGMIKSALRRLTMYWNPPNELLKSVRRSCVNGRQKWEYPCNKCKAWFALKDVEADHIIEVGKFLSEEDIVGWIKRLFVEREGWQVLCKLCHLEKTHRR